MSEVFLEFGDAICFLYEDQFRFRNQKFYRVIKTICGFPRNGSPDMIVKGFNVHFFTHFLFSKELQLIN